MTVQLISDSSIQQDNLNLEADSMQKEQIIKVTWMQNFNQFWIETDGVLRQNKTQLPKLYRLKDRSCVHRNPDVMAHFDESSGLYDEAALFLINS